MSLTVNPYLAQVGKAPNYLEFYEKGTPKETVKKMIEKDIEKTSNNFIHTKSYGLNLTYKLSTDAGRVRVNDLETQLFALEQMPEPEPEPEPEPQRIVIQMPHQKQLDPLRILLAGSIVLIVVGIIVWRLK